VFEKRSRARLQGDNGDVVEFEKFSSPSLRAKMVETEDLRVQNQRT
jgi:hypothetical protein